LIVGTERERPDGSLDKFPARLYLPEYIRAVAVAVCETLPGLGFRDERLAVGAEDEARDAALVARERAQQVARLSIPQFDCLIAAAQRTNAAVRTKRERHHYICVSGLYEHFGIVRLPACLHTEEDH
jgi:hypothetical protein